MVLCIDTATENGIICLAENKRTIISRLNTHAQEHASFLQVAIKEILEEAETPLSSVSAFATSAGPGSYTGLRVSLSTAKGLAYATGKPLILLNTLEIMAYSAIDTWAEQDGNILFCPMIDARRDEVFTGVYNRQLVPVMQPVPMILTGDSFEDILQNNKIVFFGNGSAKFSNIMQHRNAVFRKIERTENALSQMACDAFSKKLFSDVAYSEPYYCKEFYSSKSL